WQVDWPIRSTLARSAQHPPGLGESFAQLRIADGIERVAGLGRDLGIEGRGTTDRRDLARWRRTTLAQRRERADIRLDDLDAQTRWIRWWIRWWIRRWIGRRGTKAREHLLAPVGHL